MMTVRAPRSPTRAGRLPGGTGADPVGLAVGRRDRSGRGAAAGLAPGDACAPAWRAGPDRLATLVTAPPLGLPSWSRTFTRTGGLVPNPPPSPSYGYVAPFCTVQPAPVSAL